MSGDKLELIPFPELMEVSVSESEILFINKLRRCCVLYDFSAPRRDLMWKKLKKVILLELIEFMDNEHNIITDNIYPEALNMISVNLFRTLPPSNNSKGPEFKQEPYKCSDYLDWSHLKLVYKLFLRLLELPNYQLWITKQFINQQYLVQILQLFDSENPRERAFLKNVLHSIYGKCFTLRTFIRNETSNIFFRFVYETEYHNGIAELLEFLCSVIAGFVSPIKDEHKTLLLKTIMPLHKVHSLSLYHSQLSYSIVLFLNNEPNLIEPVIKSLLKLWPKACSAKEILFLNEVEFILVDIESREFQKVMVPLFRQIAKCILSLNSQVVQNALHLWADPHITKLIVQYKKVILPILFPSLYRTVDTHWNEIIRSDIYNILAWFMGIDLYLFQKCEKMFALKQKEYENLLGDAPKSLLTENMHNSI